MATRDIYEAVAAITYPLPGPEALSGNDHLSAGDLQLILGELRDEAVDNRERLIADLHRRAEMTTDDGEDPYFDPLLDELARCAQEVSILERRMALLIAYAREFVRPQPYQLKVLASAAGMSMSGIRIAYDEDEIREVAEATGHKPRRPIPQDES